MQRNKALATPYTSWSWRIVMVVLLAGLAAPVQAREEEEITITSSGIKISVVGNKIRIETPIPVVIEEEEVTITSSGIKVSVVGNKIRIETPIPVVIDVKAPAVGLVPAKPGENLLLVSWRGPIIIAPTP